IIGIFLLYAEFGTLRIEEILAGAPELWEFASPTATLAAFLLLGGAIGKSAQLPLQTWLPDAMAGPSPVSALIHAATMVTAGVYLIARTHAIFEMAPMAQSAVAIIGAATLLVAGFSALTQKDIKRILAYSTMSQIGYMFLALGVGAWSAAVFHFMIHAFFKALLFLGAGAIIMVLHHEHDIFKMGGLYKRLPKIFWTFLIASASLAALPIISAGFYSKDLILWETFASTKGSTLLWALGFVGAFITALYTFRMVFVTFFNKLGIEPTHRPGLQITIPLLILAFFSFAGGFIELPHTLGEVQWFSGVMHQVLPAFEPRPVNENSEWILQLITGLSSLLAVALAYLLYIRKHSLVEQWRNSLLGAGLNRFWYGGWGFDTLYQHLFIIPLESISRINKDDVIDLLALGSTKIIVFFNGVLVGTQSGKMRWYMAAITLGAVIILTLVVML
ncbi:MAG: NADH-quinone oxidoreductase subunit L, partial [Cyclobacteriaceae bacterium]|nr:NADH-quinone oxidoreductase subunit L [Cyclobacteriaceae bacterium]